MGRSTSHPGAAGHPSPPPPPPLHSARILFYRRITEIYARPGGQDSVFTSVPCFRRMPSLPSPWAQIDFTSYYSDCNLNQAQVVSNSRGLSWWLRIVRISYVRIIRETRRDTERAEERTREGYGTMSHCEMIAVN